jgi:hypothetical protein
MNGEPIELSWLQKQVTIGEAEFEHMVHTERLGPDPVPFGFINAKWRELLSLMEEGDELWTFFSSGESWNSLAGREGIALLRRGQVIETLVVTTS